MKKLLLFPCLLLALGLSSCESSDDEIMSIELVSPKKLAVTTELATASFKWDAVAKAEGYAYALDNSTEYTTIDGTEPATATASYTTFGINISSDKDAAPAYLANRGLTDWGIKYCYEFPGYVRLSNSASGSNMYYGVLTTPKLSKLTAASIVTVTFDAVRFASEHDIPVKVLNAGTIASAQVVVEGSGSAASTAPESGGKSINITSAHCPKHGNEALKKWSNFSITIEGATAETQICWDTTGAGSTSANGRICLDNIVVRKN